LLNAAWQGLIFKENPMVDFRAIIRSASPAVLLKYQNDPGAMLARHHLPDEIDLCLDDALQREANQAGGEPVQEQVVETEPVQEQQPVQEQEFSGLRLYNPDTEEAA
jgi:hypothetical protein